MTMDKSEEIKARAARYNRVERVEDAYGRIIGVKMLKASQRIRIEEMAPGLSGDVQVEDKDGKVFDMPKILRLIWTASVCEIDGAPIAFPASRKELDVNVDILDDAGMSAAAEGFFKLSMGDKTEDSPNVKDSAKNSQPTPDFDKPAG